ncbi:Ribonuclease T2-like [Parasponia andersonii]|uniref:Ribonuclease T2-like n=1 Tax=Parasponia andersonii TaxID=3476 RepID=A0A2P5CBB7_PARAD|nr:Ribonuclease T2-like [Parasponia andersonii]
MKTYDFAMVKILVPVSYLSVLCVSQDFDFFYFVQQWPGDTKKKSCCYPKSGKPAADFGVHGLWPNFNNGSYPSDCDPNNPYDQSQILDLIGCMEEEWPTFSCPSNNGTKFWAHEWNKHGTCSKSVLDQHDYFQATLNLKKKVDLLQALQTAGIEPNGTFYKLDNIGEAIKNGIGYTPGITCNGDASGHSQLHEIYFCVDTCGSNFIECSLFPNGRCSSEVEFPSF